MTRKMNEEEWHYKWLEAERTGDYRFIGDWAAWVIENNMPRERKLDDWIKPFVDSVNERFKQCGKQ